MTVFRVKEEVVGMGKEVEMNGGIRKVKPGFTKTDNRGIFGGNNLL